MLICPIFLFILKYKKHKLIKIMARYENPYLKIKPKIQGPYTQIYLVRHCNPDYTLEKAVGSENIPLSKVGIEQRNYLNKRFAKMPIDKIYSSALLRARQTAESIARKKNMRIVIDDRLNEIDWKDWYKIRYFKMSEKTRVRRVAGYQRMERELGKYQDYARRLLADLFAKNKGRNIAVFCHGNLIKSMVTGILNTDVIGFLSLEVYQSSVTKIVIDRDGFVKINYINSICHLPKRPDEDLFLFALNQ